jgi:ATP-binding cassette subfamily B (MDR/TAP) protein 1
VSFNLVFRQGGQHCSNGVRQATVPLVIGLGLSRAWLISRKDRRTRALFSKAIVVVGQTFSGIRVTTAFPAIADAMSAEFVRRLDEPLRVMTAMTPRDTIVFGVTQMILIWTIALAFWFGSRQIADGVFTVGG